MIALYVLIAIVLTAIGIVIFIFNPFKKEAKVSDVGVKPIDSLDNDLTLHQPAEEINYKKKIDDLETELNDLSRKSTDQASESFEVISRLTKENENLKLEKIQISNAHIELSDIEKQKDQFKQDNFLLSNQLEQSHIKINHLENELNHLRQQVEIDLKLANENIDALKAEREQIILNRESTVGSIQSFAREQDEANLKIQALSKELSELNEANQILRSSNESIFSQAQIFQQELTRQRAQIAGLERICENYRLQIEENVQ